MEIPLSHKYAISVGVSQLVTALHISLTKSREFFIIKTYDKDIISYVRGRDRKCCKILPFTWPRVTNNTLSSGTTRKSFIFNFSPQDELLKTGIHEILLKGLSKTWRLQGFMKEREENPHILGAEIKQNTCLKWYKCDIKIMRGQGVDKWSIHSCTCLLCPYTCWGCGAGTEVVVCTRLQRSDHTHHTPLLFSNSLLVPRFFATIRPKCWPGSLTPLASPRTHSLPLLTPLVTSWSTVGGSAGPADPLWSLSESQDCRDPVFPAGLLLKAVNVFLLVIIQMDKITIQVTASSQSEDLALWLEKAAPALLRYGPHAVQSGILRHHMLEERWWWHKDRFMCAMWSEPLWQNTHFEECWINWRKLLWQNVNVTN